MLNATKYNYKFNLDIEFNLLFLNRAHDTEI